MKSDRKQTLILIGISMLLLSGVFLYIALSQPRIYAESDSDVQIVQSISDDSTAASDSEDADISQTSVSSAQTTGTSAASSWSTSAEASAAVSTTASETTTSTTSASETTTVITYPLNLNTCTLEELMTLDGIGEARASAIISYRNYLGGYTSVDQIMNISGIGESIYAKVAPYLTV